jgi:hypothetical protein
METLARHRHIESSAANTSAFGDIHAGKEMQTIIFFPTVWAHDQFFVILAVFVIRIFVPHWLPPSADTTSA